MSGLGVRMATVSACQWQQVSQRINGYGQSFVHQSCASVSCRERGGPGKSWASKVAGGYL